MIKNLALTLLFITFSGQAFAEGSKHVPSISAADALQKINDIQPAQYESIELLPGKDGKLVYFAEASKDDQSVITVIDSNSGNDMTEVYVHSQYSLQDALRFVNNSFSGTVSAAYKEIYPDIGIVYLISLSSDLEEANSNTLVVSANSLKVIDSLSHEELLQDDSSIESWHEEYSPL